MTKGIRWSATAAALALSFAIAPATHAAQAAWMSDEGQDVELSEGDLIDAGAAPAGRTNWGQSLKFSGPGKLSVSSYDLGVAGTLMDRLDSLSFSVSNATSILAAHTGDGLMTIDINGPGEYFVAFCATPSGTSRFKLPLVSWSLYFAPDAATVPLPASAWLLIAGLAWAIGMQRKRAKLAASEGGDSARWNLQGALAH